MVQPDQACGAAAGGCREDVKLESRQHPAENFFKEKESVGDSSDCCLYSLAVVANARISNEYAREEPVMMLELLPGESRGYWKHHALKKWFKQAKASGKVNNTRANLLFDSGVVVSILDIAFARKVGCQIDMSKRQDCVGIGEVGALLGMDFMVPAEIRLDMEDGTICLPDEVRIQLAGRKILYSGHISEVKLGQYVNMSVTKSLESALPDSAVVKDTFDGNQPAEVSLSKEAPRIDEFGMEKVWVHESGELCAEDIDKNWSIIPEVAPSTDEVTMEDIQIPDPGVTLKKQVDRLLQINWQKRHLLMGKGNALPPAARGAVCDIDVGNARPIAQRVRKVAPQLREKLSDLIKGLLSSKIIQHSTSPWSSSIVIIVKKNGVDIRFCIDYRMVNELTRLMVYPMPLVNEVLDDLDKAFWYCSLDMSSGFWVISMTKRARLISAFVTPFGLSK
ncbi:unnamed protein product [Peronospora effusa]|nr:unnamed protein product [Peronospora effusa]